MNADFPRILTLLRKEKGISQKQAAQELNVSQALLSHYEKGILSLIHIYTSMPLNIAGQVCLPFSLLWVGVSFGALQADRILNQLFSRFGKPVKSAA